MKRTLPPFNYILVADAVFRNGSFKGAASDLNVTPSAVSHQIKQIEDWLGFKLFNRRRKVISPTPLGGEFLKRIAEHLDGIEGATLDAREARGTRRTVRIQTTDSFARMVLIKRVAKLRNTAQSCPEMPIARISTSEFTEAFRLAEADIAILFGDGDFGDLKILFSQEERLMPACNPSILSTNSTLTPSQILNFPLITDYLLGKSWRQWCQFMAYTPTKADLQQIDRSLLVNHSHLAIEAAIDGQGVALVSDILAGDAILAGQLVPLTDQWLPTGKGYHIVTKANGVRQLVTTFGNWLAKELSTGFVDKV